MNAQGTFVITMHPEPPYDVFEGVSLSRIGFDKTFSGDLVATSVVAMIGARTPVPDSAGYVAIERVTGTLAGKTGSFVLQHSGTMHAGTSTLSVTVVPGSGTGELGGLAGRMQIDRENSGHQYRFEYSFEDAPEANRVNQAEA